MPGAEAVGGRSLSVDSDGLTLAAWTTGESGPPLVLVHGFPDTHVVWDPIVHQLSDRFRCISYDVRGAGASQAPSERAGYRMANLLSDLVHVLDATAGDDPVHVVAHDWGSIQMWDAVVRERSDPRLTGRIASYTSISGPCLHHVDAFIAAARRGGWHRRRDALRQGLHSWYVYAFQVPVLPELVLGWHNRRLLARSGGHHLHFADTLVDDVAHGLELYRANIFHRERVPGGPRTMLPVQLLVPLHDRYVTPEVTQDVGRFVPHLTRVELDAGHWVPRTHPELVAGLVADFALASDAGRSRPTEGHDEGGDQPTDE